MIWIFCLYICFSNSGVQALNITLDESRDIEEGDIKSCYLKSNPTLSGKYHKHCSDCILAARTKIGYPLSRSLGLFVPPGRGEISTTNNSNISNFSEGFVQDVYVGIMVLDIDQIREDSMDFRLHCYLYTKWTNHRMNITVVNQMYPVLLPPVLTDCMWKPDVIFPNSLEIVTFVSTVTNRGYKYFENKEILCTERFMFRVSCPMHFSLFPLDTQHCEFRIGLMLNPDNKVILRWNENYGNGGVGYFYEMQPLQFYISKPRLDQKTEVWLSGNYTELRSHVTFYRRLTSSFLNFYIPSSLVVILSWISFYIDVEAAPARVTLGVTALLTTSTQMIEARNSLPPVQYITSMDVWLFFCLTLVFASIIEYSIAYTYRCRFKRKVRDITKFKRSNIKVLETKDSKPSSSINELERNQNLGATTEKLDKICRWLFPLIMSIFCISYWSFLYCHIENTTF